MQTIHTHLSSLGYNTERLPAVLHSGKEYRIPSLGKGNRNTSTSIKLTHDGVYVWRDHANDTGGIFNPDFGSKQTAPDPEIIKAREKRQALEEQAQAVKQAKAKNEAQQIWDRAKPCTDHPYMAMAGIKIAGEVRSIPYVRTQGGQKFDNPLIVPRYDAVTHELVNLEFITAEGTKRPLTGAKSKGFYFEIAGEGPAYFVEGYKTGCAVHNTTGRRVICSFNVGNLKTIWPLMSQPNDAIIADNDNSPRKNDFFVTSQITRSKGAGHKAAYELGAKFWLVNTIGADAADISADQLRDLLAQDPTSSLPIFDAWKDLKPSYDEISAADLLESLSKQKDPLKAAEMALNYGLKRLQVVPYKENVIELRAQMEAVTRRVVHPVTLDNIAQRLDWVIAQKHLKAKKIVKIEDVKGHNHIKVNSLDELKPEYKGVWLVSAPTGSRKTQLVGRSFREYCGQNNFEFLSLAHLRTLIKEMANRLETTHYEDEKEAIKKAGGDSLRNGAESLSVCLPSIGHRFFESFIKQAKHVFIDEISQVLNAFSSDEMFKNVAPTQVIFDIFGEIIRNAECLICADANINQDTLDFIEQCRPAGEKFNIVEMAPKDEGKTAHLYASEAELLKKITYELMVNDANVWITTDSKKKAEALTKVLSQYDELTIMSVVGGEKNNRKSETQQFLANIEQESKKYRVVISSPAISSGVSVEHNDAPHFDIVAGFFSGYSVLPTDAYQMIGRVRYAKDFHLYISQRNETVISADRQIEAQQQAAALEGTQGKVTAFTEFRAHLNQSRAQINSEFANNLVFILNHKRFDIQRAEITGAVEEEEMLKEANAEINEQEREAIKSAAKITDEQAQKLSKKDPLNDSEYYSLAAFKRRKALGYNWTHDLTDQDLDMSASMVRRYSAFIGRYSRSEDKAQDLASRKYSEALAKAYRLAFADVDLKGGAAYTEDCAKAILENVFKHRFLLAVLGAIPARYGRDKFKPHSYAVKDLKAILEHIGIHVFRTRFSAKVGQMGLFFYRKYAASVPNSDIEKCYIVNSDRLELMQHYSDLKQSQYQQLAAGEDVIYWTNVRLELWQQADQITEQQAIDRLIAAVQGRAKTREASKTHWWATHVLRERMAA